MATEEDVQHHENNNDPKSGDLVDHQVETNPVYDQLFSLGVTLTSNKLGQYVVRKIDRLLWIIENTAKWSVPQNINESETTVPPPPLIRPLNWFLFIPALIIMRLFRAGASFALLIIGHDALTPITVVQILQKQRRILRAVRYQGLKSIRSRNTENKQAMKKGLLSVMLSFMNGLICTRGNLEEPVKIVVKSNNREDGRASKKRLLSDEDESNKDDGNDLNLTCADLLDKYGSISSCDDSDFEPEMDDEDSSSESDEESEPEGRTEANGVEEDDVVEDDHKVAETRNEVKEIKETGNEEVPNKTNNTSEPVQIIQNNNNYCNEYRKESRPATLYGSNPEDKFYSPIESPVPSEDLNHSGTYESGDSHQSKPSAKFYHTQIHNFNHDQPTRHAANHHNFHYQHNPFEPFHETQHNKSFSSADFLDYEKSFDKPHHQLSLHVNGSGNTQQYDPKNHNAVPPPSLSPTSSTASSTTNVSSTQASSTTTTNIPRKKTQTKYNKYQKNRYYGGGNKQNSKKNSL